MDMTPCITVILSKTKWYVAIYLSLVLGTVPDISDSSPNYVTEALQSTGKYGT